MACCWDLIEVDISLIGLLMEVKKELDGNRVYVVTYYYHLLMTANRCYHPEILVLY